MAPLVPYDGALFIPTYCPLASGDWELRVTGLGFAPGYWSDARPLVGMAALVRHGRAWMSITPFEIESQEVGIRHGRGHVLIFGLGMGWAAAASATIPAVTAVTVVEQDRDVLALHRALDLFAQLPETARAKLRVVEADACGYVPEAPVDLLMPDIWLPLVNDGRLDEVRAMQANVGASAIYFWGQELELARHAVAAGRDLDEAGIAATAAETGLPLVGPGQPGYAEKLAAATRRWIAGRWLPGGPQPTLAKG
jgi:hypothetical protein